MVLAQLFLTFILFILLFYYFIVKEEMTTSVEQNTERIGKSIAKQLNIELFLVSFFIVPVVCQCLKYIFCRNLLNILIIYLFFFNPFVKNKWTNPNGLFFFSGIPLISILPFPLFYVCL